MNRAVCKPRRELIGQFSGECGASGGREIKSGRRRERFNGTWKIHWFYQLNWRSDHCGLHGRYGRGQQKSNRSEQRTLRIMAAGHRASRHPGHFMSAIHMTRGPLRSFLMVMMCGNLALTGRAARGLIVRPCGACKWRVQQNDHEQANACGDGTAAMVTRSLHVARRPYMSSDTIAYDAIVCKPIRQRSSLSHTLYPNYASLSRGTLLSANASPCGTL